MVFKMELKLLRRMLGTNPVDPFILDTHILDKQRKIITEENETNATINKYLNAIQISEKRGEDELNALFLKLEEMLGRQFSEEERALAIKGELDLLKVTLAEQDVKGVTVFFKDKDTGLPCIGDHMILGFMKAASEAISRTKEKANGKILQSASYTQSIINQHVKIDREFIVFDKDVLKREDGKPDYAQRSLRAMTAQGPRISLAKSEQIPPGAVLKFEIIVMDGSPLKAEHIKEIFEYGKFKGLGQWRNVGNGSFDFIMQ